MTNTLFLGSLATHTNCLTPGIRLSRKVVLKNVLTPPSQPVYFPCLPAAEIPLGISDPASTTIHAVLNLEIGE